MHRSLIIDGGILAGGLATRMQGQDKGLQVYQDKWMVQWVYQALAPFVRKVIINCNRNLPDYQTVSEHICTDRSDNFPGPLAGIVSIIDASDADYFLLSPCDTPRLSPHYAQEMLAFLDTQLLLDQAPPPLFAVRTGDKQQPLHVCLSRHYKASLEAYLNRGEHRVMQWMRENHAQWLDFAGYENEFRNFNRLEDLRAD